MAAGFVVEADPGPFLSTVPNREPRPNRVSGISGVNAPPRPTTIPVRKVTTRVPFGTSLRGRLPRADRRRGRTRTLRRSLGEDLVGTVTVVADRGSAEKYCRRMRRRADRRGEGARRIHSRVQDLLAVALRPRDAAGGRAGQVDDRIHGAQHRRSSSTGCGRPLDLVLLLRLDRTSRITVWPSASS